MKLICLNKQRVAHQAVSQRVVHYSITVLKPIRVQIVYLRVYNITKRKYPI